MANPLAHKRVPKHTVLSKTRANKIMRDNFVDDIEMMPRILFSDPVLVRMRADGQNMSVNDIVEIERFSVTTGVELTWRVIVDE